MVTLHSITAIKFLIKASRPRFWSYLAGPYIVGFSAGMATKFDLATVLFIIPGLFFLFPANTILYGVNDIADSDTDAFNPKKQDREVLLQHQQQRLVIAAVIVSLLLFIFLTLSFASPISWAILLGWLGLSLLYSLPPFRLKAHPFVDSVSNILYILPGVFGYFITAGHLPPFGILLAASVWAMAMHLFSAVPDIQADEQAGLQTTAVVLGFQKSLYLCSALWLLSTILTSQYLAWQPLSLLGLVYPLMALAAARSTQATIKMYWLFPYLNAVIGFILFLVVFLPKNYV